MTSPAPLVSHAPPAFLGRYTLPGVLGPGPTAEHADQFLEVLGRQGTAAPDQPAEARARSAAEQFVSVALVQPLLAQLRDTNAAAPPYAPTPGEKQFRSLADASLAGEIVRAAQFPLVDLLARRMLERLNGSGGAESVPTLQGTQGRDA